MTTRRRIQAGDGDRRHGTVNGYCNLLCRCQPCKEAWRADPRQRAARLRWRRRNGYLPYEVHLAVVWATRQPCGTHAAYNRHRKAGEAPCDECRAGEARYKAQRRQLQRAAA